MEASLHFSGVTEGNHENPMSVKPVSWTMFEKSAYPVPAYSVTANPNMLNACVKDYI
jgi:hypothetical protein